MRFPVKLQLCLVKQAVRLQLVCAIWKLFKGNIVNICIIIRRKDMRYINLVSIREKTNMNCSLQEIKELDLSASGNFLSEEMKRIHCILLIFKVTSHQCKRLPCRDLLQENV